MAPHSMDQRRLDELAALPADWNGGAEKPIGAGALAVAEVLAVVPLYDGGPLPSPRSWSSGDRRRRPGRGRAAGWDVEIEVTADGEPTGVYMARIPSPTPPDPRVPPCSES